MSYSKRLFDDFVFGNFFISICALSMIFTTFLMNKIPLQFTPFTIFIAAATYMLYNFHKHSFKIDYTSSASISGSLRKIRIRTSELIMYIIAGLIMIISFFFLSINILPFLFPLAVLSLAYSAPILRKKNKKIRLLEVYFIKTPVLALVWGISTTIIPLVEQNITIMSSFVGWQVLSRTLFIFALCIPFEIRDLEKDKKNNVKTLAVILGRKKTMIVGLVVIFFELITHHLMNISLQSQIALDLSSVVAMIWILIQEWKSGKYYFKFFVDGTMIIRFIFLYISILFI